VGVVASDAVGDEVGEDEVGDVGPVVSVGLVEVGGVVVGAEEVGLEGGVVAVGWVVGEVVGVFWVVCVGSEVGCTVVPPPPDVGSGRTTR
jgi:hypothetical protein